MTTLYYFHDPMCSWCWGYRPVADLLFSSLPDGIAVKKTLGGLAPDSDQPMPRAQRETIAGTWRRIQAMLGTDFNHEFWSECEPRRSTYPACRAVIAAAKQQHADEMIVAVQNAYFLEARNPSDLATLLSLAGQLGLDTAAFSEDMASVDTEAELQRQLTFTREAGVRGFPSLALEKNGQLIHLDVDYESHESTLNMILRAL